MAEILIAGYGFMHVEDDPDECQHCGNITPGNLGFCSACESQLMEADLEE